MGEGEILADGTAEEVLSGGWYFATEVARALGAGGPITPERGAELLRGRAAGGWALMDFRLATMLGLLAVLAVGVMWFERSRPSSRVVALVASLTALAVASRLVLAPIPNVVGTTDVALLTGYALGGPPGFMVGALAAPISNIWLGQGPWTVWQMAGWGLAGLAGAGLAVAAGRNLGRLGFALACGAMGLLYGALLDLSVMVTYGGEQSLDRYLALSARGVPFNIAHAAGNFAIAFAAGPALVRMISRFRERLEFTWHPAGALPVALAALVVAMGSVGTPEAQADAGSGRAWLERMQNADGGFAASPGQPSSAAMTDVGGARPGGGGRNPLDVERGATRRSTTSATRGSPLRPTWSGRSSRSRAPASIRARSRAATWSPLRSKRSSDGSWEGQVNITAFGILALRAAGQGDTASRQIGFGTPRTRTAGGDSRQAGARRRLTGAALQALAVAGGSSSALGGSPLPRSDPEGRGGGRSRAGS